MRSVYCRKHRFSKIRATSREGKCGPRPSSLRTRDYLPNRKECFQQFLHTVRPL